MPLLGHNNAVAEKQAGLAVRAGRSAAGLFPVCANAACASGWLRLWRARQTPVFEGGWACGEECMRANIRAAVLREMQGGEEPVRIHRHRVPLGMVLVAQGAITQVQLRGALARQKAGGGRLGEWLVREFGVEEQAITRGLSSQWGCPVLSLDNHFPEKTATLVPRLFVDAFAVLPLRVAGSVLLYIGFEDRIDRCVAFALERMTGLRVEAGVVDGDRFEHAHRRMLAAAFPPARLVEASGAEPLVRTLTRIVEEIKPVQAKLVRLHDYFWLRMWKRLEHAGRVGSSVQDVVCSLVDFRARP